MNNNGTGTAYPVWPEVGFEREELASLRLRLDFYDDLIDVTKFEQGQARNRFVADPLDVAQAIGEVPVASGLLPEGVLFWGRREGEERIGLWVPPGVHEVEVHLSGWSTVTIPLPGLVWIGQGKRYTLLALADEGRPNEASQLYRPPLPNVSDNGICAGSVSFPVATVATMPQAWQAFIGSGFNNHLANGKSRKYQADDILRMWRVLDRAGADQYPVGDLVPVGKQLREVV